MTLFSKKKVYSVRHADIEGGIGGRVRFQRSSQAQK